jgi:mannose-6-phosphate isomerase-like protein (cupin superfamily)
MHLEGEQGEVEEGDTVYVPPGTLQHVTNTGPTRLSFLCIVEPAWRAEDEVVMRDS